MKCLVIKGEGLDKDLLGKLCFDVFFFLIGYFGRVNLNFFFLVGKIVFVGFVFFIVLKFNLMFFLFVVKEFFLVFI